MEPARAKMADERAVHGGGVHGLNWWDIGRKSS